MQFVLRDVCMIPPSRVAILCLTERSYTCNSRRLLGLEQLRWRHLEIMGYKVVEVSIELLNLYTGF